MRVNADVYKQAYTYHDKRLPFNKPIPLRLSRRDLLYGYAQIPCSECDGTGVFAQGMPYEGGCVACKETGKEWVTIV